MCGVAAENNRHAPDPDLITEAEYYQREIADRTQQGQPCQTQQWRLNCLMYEVNRRRRLSKMVPFRNSPGIPLEIIAEIKRRATGHEFVEFVERCVGSCAIKRGQRYWIHCPVHHEKGPSFCIYPEQGTVHCYGCHFDADVFGLLVDMPPNLKFPDAIREAARFFHVPIPEPKPVKQWRPADGIAARG